MKPSICVIGLIFFTAFTVFGADLKGANAIITQLQQAQTSPAAKLTDLAKDPFQKALTEYQSNSPKLVPSAATEGWLALLPLWNQSRPNRNRYSASESDIGFNSLIQVLPPPAAWSDLQKGMATGPLKEPIQDSLLALFAATLTNDEAAKWQAFESFKEASSVPNTSSASTINKLLSRVTGRAGRDSFLENASAEIAQALAQLSDNPEAILDALTLQLEMYSGPEYRGRNSIQVPDLVTLTGEKKAQKFLLQALASPVSLNVRGRQTLELAQKLALENVSKLKVPQWGLITNVRKSDRQLYEALIKRFPDDSDSDSDRTQAGGLYLLSLIAAGETEKAKKFALDPRQAEATDLSYNGVNAMRAAGYGKAMSDFLFALLKENPDLPYWNDLMTLAAEQHQTAEALNLAIASLERDNLTPAKRLLVLAQLSDAYLAHDEIDKGLASLQERLKLLQAEDSPDSSDIGEIARRLASLGLLLNQPALVDQGLNLAMEIDARKEDTYRDADLVKLLMKAGRKADAETVAINSLRLRLKEGRDSYRSGDLKRELTTLAGIYDEAGKGADVLELLTTAPWWNAKNLGAIVEELDYRRVPLGLMVAKALLQGGDSAQALATVKATLQQAPANDSAYALLVELEGEKAIPFLDEQFARDRFQERPLIWKAALLLKAGKLAEADAIIREAIAIDPSDGEMKPPDRMRAYAVLADILEAQSNPEGAKLYRGAVQAIRLSEEADRYQEAGLLSQAVKRYEEALTHFSDAYCIQSRLAIQFMKLGEPEKAELHYLKAYELMPDSFGRMESHCFGCERAFAGELAETLAEKTFGRLIEKNPNKPQLHYLLGYLRLEQERYPEALASFQKAVELDPDYINAWKKIAGLNDQVALSRGQFDEAALALVRLDPYSRHGSNDLTKVGDLAKMWTTLESLQSRIPPATEATLIPLTASVEAIAQREKEFPERAHYASMNREPKDQIPTPREILTRHELIRPVVQTLTQLHQMNQ